MVGNESDSATKLRRTAAGGLWFATVLVLDKVQFYFPPNVVAFVNQKSTIVNVLFGTILIVLFLFWYWLIGPVVSKLQTFLGRGKQKELRILRVAEEVRQTEIRNILQDINDKRALKQFSQTFRASPVKSFF